MARNKPLAFRPNKKDRRNIMDILRSPEFEGWAKSMIIRYALDRLARKVKR